MGSEPSMETWKQLVDAAVRLKALAPWRWMTEEAVFGVTDPEADRTGFVSVMGMEGQHLAVAVYLGAEGLLGFVRLESGELHDYPEGIFEVPHLQASFENREHLDTRDRRILKDLGYRFRGKMAWPRFRAFRPGWEPTRPDEAGARFLAVAIEQVLDVGPRLAEDPSRLYGGRPGTFLHRVAKRVRGRLRWEDRYLPPPPLPDLRIPIAVERDLIEQVQGLPVGLNAVEVDAGLLPVPVGPRRGERFYPVLVLVADARTGHVYHAETLEPVEPYEHTYGQVPQVVFEGFVRVGQRPREVVVRPGIVASVFQAVAHDLRWLRVSVAEVLPAAGSAREALAAHLMRGPS